MKLPLEYLRILRFAVGGWLGFYGVWTSSQIMQIVREHGGQFSSLTPEGLILQVLAILMMIIGIWVLMGDHLKIACFLGAVVVFLNAGLGLQTLISFTSHGTLAFFLLAVGSAAARVPDDLLARQARAAR